MREKQLAQEAKKLDAKVGGTKSWGLEQRIRRGWRENSEMENWSPETTQRVRGWSPKGWGEGLWEGIPR